MDMVIKNAIESVRAELEDLQISLSDTKAERKAIRHAISGGNAIVSLIESYHGFEWADKIGSEASQQTVNELVRREAWLDREISRFRDAIKARTISLTKYEMKAESEKQNA
jgi:aspartate ammonia-lyase